MKDTTLVIPIHPEKGILLGMKKRGFGKGRWNGFGGKLSEGESIEQAAIRELREEIGIHTKELALKKVAEITFVFPTKQEWSQRCHVYLVHSWAGQEQESEEMLPQWFQKSQIPFESMWPDDPLWLPHVLTGKFIKAEFCMKEDQNGFETYSLDMTDTDSIL